MAIPRIAFIFAITAFLAGLGVATFSELRIFLPALLRGAVVTVQVSVLSIALFLLTAFVAGIARAFGTAPVRWSAAIFVEVFRGTSLLVILFWFFFVLPEFGVVMPPMVAAVLGIGLNFGAYGAEVVRGAVQSVPRGQTEASIALNMTQFKRMTRIIIPQAVVITIPGLSNLTIELIKATALVSAVTLTDITFASVQQNQLHYRTLEIFAITVLLYYCLAQFIRFGGGWLEDHFSRHLKPRSA
ncbi:MULTISPECIES: ectoine/hydroxyectoine ABC transporter permease subunit EhuC [unclassified Roseitalea]|uniref:ectoine/hydroxyectoine ABC transporter permease subunit EhuC n=1 Tax=unclassified Roseitalea TaxID=2639107 RepID=UPI00274000AF|nr:MULTISPECIES: ectoine/hydroxyectoine ABC transporter permease subunit EhuC [unclassified Roseitalea]